MSTTEKRPRRTKGKATKTKSRVVGPVPDDALGSASDPPPPPGSEAPPLAIDERFDHLLSNPDLFTAVRRALPPRDPSGPGRRPFYPPYIYFVFLCLAYSPTRHPGAWRTA